MNSNHRQQRPKPGDDERTLPPLLPAYAVVREPDDDLETNRVFELPLVAHSVMVYGEQNSLSATQQRNLVTAFDCECSAVQKIVQQQLLKVHISDHWRIDHYNRIRDLCVRLAEEIEESLKSRSVNLDKVIRLNREYLSLLGLYGFFLKAEIANRRAENVQALLDKLGLGAGVQATQGSGTPPPATGPLSKPMSKSRMMAALGIDSQKSFNTWAKGKLIRINRQSWQVRFAMCAPNERAKLEKA